MYDSFVIVSEARARVAHFPIRTKTRPACRSACAQCSPSSLSGVRLKIGSACTAGRCRHPVFVFPATAWSAGCPGLRSAAHWAQWRYLYTSPDRAVLAGLFQGTIRKVRLSRCMVALCSEIPRSKSAGCTPAVIVAQACKPASLQACKPASRNCTGSM